MSVRILRTHVNKYYCHRSRLDSHERFENDIFTCEKFALFMTRSQERSEKLQDFLRRKKRLIWIFDRLTSSCIRFHREWHVENLTYSFQYFQNRLFDWRWLFDQYLIEQISQQNLQMLHQQIFAFRYLHDFQNRKRSSRIENQFEMFHRRFEYCCFENFYCINELLSELQYKTWSAKTKYFILDTTFDVQKVNRSNQFSCFTKNQ